MIVLQAHHQLKHGILGSAECYIYKTASGSIATAVIYGRIVPEEEILVRIQSACLYGEVLLATDCDCRAQLNQSMRDIREAGCGVIVHLDQEGRGAGIVTKAKAYELLDRNGLDTVEAYKKMNVELDSRTYEVPIEILKNFKIERVRLITNNPRKVAALRDAQISVSRAIQRIAATDANIDYLHVKATKLGHLLDLPQAPNGGRDKESFRFTVVGAAVMDHVLRVPTNPPMGRTRQSTGYRRQPGGKGFNQAIALARLGGHSALLTSRGADTDALEISEALVAESVSTWFVDTAQIRSPQTVVIEPRDSQPTYVGWLTAEHRVLPTQHISRWSNEIGASDAVLFTMETSPKTIESVLNMLSERTLVVLTAAPAVEGRRVSTNLLERIDVVIGAENELRALYGEGQDRSKDDDIIHNLTEFCGLTVILTDLKASARTVKGFNRYLDKPVSVQSPSVRAFDRLAAAVGNGDVFSAAFTLETLRRSRDQNGSNDNHGWQDAEAFFSRGTNLLDVLLEAVVVEAWVVKSGAGGYLTFPTQQQIDKWVHQAPQVLDVPSEVPE